MITLVRAHPSLGPAAIIAAIGVANVILMAGALPLDARFVLVALGALIAAVVMVAEGWSWGQFGFRTDNLVRGVFPYLAFTAVGFVSLVGLAWINGRGLRSVFFVAPLRAYLVVLLPLCALQEVVFRGYLVPKLIPMGWIRWPLHGALFASIHVIYPQPAVILPLTFVGGIAFSWVYERCPNLWLVALAHLILNATAVAYCFVSFVGGC